MPVTEQLVIDLPSDIVALVRSRMASGKYENESAVIEEALVDTILPLENGGEANDGYLYFESDAGWGPSDEWLVKHALPALDELEADPTSGISHEDLVAELAARRAMSHGRSD